jgi:hypothetical protein
MINQMAFDKPVRQIVSGPRLAAIVLILGLLFLPLSAEAYICGDNNGDGMINIGDAVHVIQFVFNNGPACDPPEAGDANCDGIVNVGDAVSIISRVFRDGPEPCCECAPISQPILFEKCYANYAWVHTYNGFYINNQGHVIQYNFTGSIPYADPWYTEYDEATLLWRYSHNPVMVDVIPTCMLHYYWSMVEAAAAGELSPAEGRCFDFGVMYWVAYIFNEDTQLYQPVLLTQMGDYAQTNFSSEAQTLFWWLYLLEGNDPDDVWCTY